MGHILWPTSHAWFVLPVAKRVVESLLFIAETIPIVPKSCLS